ncbi:hypothetical protein B0T10DRAFT_12087 [Thelonectria olida]|uniref:Transmembrane protein n=1 Tax=Thelonectria olida TaxID=1576542 RepID=A0A9P8WK47_9HYPO|nr:hypothetical protein B0T10DRAFT_12087 [Thelonectria olida]
MAGNRYTTKHSDAHHTHGMGFLGLVGDEKEWFCKGKCGFPVLFFFLLFFLVQFCLFVILFDCLTFIHPLGGMNWMGRWEWKFQTGNRNYLLGLEQIAMDSFTGGNINLTLSMLAYFCMHFKYCISQLVLACDVCVTWGNKRPCTYMYSVG